MRILSIGNSFSQDAQRWLHQIAGAAGVELTVKNLYIGGCTLETHWNNFESEAEAYAYETNGVTENSPRSSIQAALREGGWDIITFQQQSGRAGRPETYMPYLEKLIEGVKSICPDAKLWFQETWEYGYDSTHGDFGFYEKNCDVMYGMIYATTHAFCERYGLGLIPSGEAVHAAKRYPEFDSRLGGQSLYRDAFHMHLLYGRMLLGYVWLKKLCEVSPVGNTFVPEGADSGLLERLQVVADRF